MKSLRINIQLLKTLFFFKNKWKRDLLLHDDICTYLNWSKCVFQYITTLIITFTLFACTNNDKKMSYKKTNIECKDTIVELGKIPISFKKDTFISLKNTGKEPLIINKVTSTCGCTVANWDKAPTLPQVTTIITVGVQRFEKGFFSKELCIHCNSEQSPIIIKIRGTIISK